MINLRAKNLVLALCLLANCGQPGGQSFVRSDLRSQLQIAKLPAPSDSMLWSGHGMFLVAPNKDEAFKNWAMNRKLMLVTLPEINALARSLATSDTTLAYSPATDDQSGFALVEIQTEDQATKLAQEAHEGTQGCGMLQRLRLLDIGKQSTSFIAPVFIESVKRKAVADLVSTNAAGLKTALQTSIQTSIQALESLGTRFHTTASGQGAPAQIKAMFETAAAGKISGLSVQLNPHQESRQSSVVVTIPGRDDPNATGPTVIIGAHLDSINSGGEQTPAPGADDDASGVATLIEILRGIADTGARFQRTVELHAYGAEEVGLIGSSEIAERFRTTERQVVAMMQIDMNAWSSDAGSDTIYLVTNSTKAVLRRSLKTLINSYLGGNVVDGTLKAGQSDHVSWYNAGFNTVFPFENPINYNSALHTPRDTSATINNLNLSARFVESGFVFLSHLAGLTSAESGYDTDLKTLRGSLGKDLYVAVKAGANPDQYDLFVSGGSDIKSLELCEAHEAGGMTCQKELLSGTFNVNKGNRALYTIATGIAIRSGIHLTIFGYNATDQLVAQRSVRLDKI